MRVSTRAKNLSSWTDGNRVRLGPIDHDLIKTIVYWLHDQHGGRRHWESVMGLGLGGYRAGPFRVNAVHVGHGKYMMDVLLPDEAAAMQCFLIWN